MEATMTTQPNAPKSAPMDPKLKQVLLDKAKKASADCKTAQDHVDAIQAWSDLKTQALISKDQEVAAQAGDMVWAHRDMLSVLERNKR